MRIGYLTYGLDRAPTGIGRYALELLRALVAMPHGHEIVVLATEREDRHGLGELCEYHALAGCRLLPSLLTFGNMVVAATARRLDLDVLHDPNGIAPFLGPRRGVARVVTIHDAFAYVYPETHNRLDNWRYRWHLPQAARRADAVVTVSESSRRDLRRYLGLLDDRVHLMTEGVNPRFRPIEDADQRRAVLTRYGITPPYLLYLGGLNARKNLARLFEAYAGLRVHHPGVTLVIGGKRQWQTGEMERALQELRLEDHVHFTGYVDDADLPALYSGAEAFVFPSLYEGFGLPPLEAMACGTPVVTSNVSSLPEVVGEAALTVDPYDVAGLTDAIHQVLTDQQLRRQLRQLGLVQAARFTWEATAQATYRLYEQLTREATSSRTPEAGVLRRGNGNGD